MAMRRTVPIAFLAGSIVTALAAGRPVEAAGIQPGSNDNQCMSGTVNRQNVILIVLDDTSAADFPGMNAPLVWKTSANPQDSADGFAEASLARPDLNRLAARVFAKSSGCSGGSPQTGNVCLGSSTDQAGDIVVPADLDVVNGGTALPTGSTVTDTQNFRYRHDAPGTDPTHHILEGFGGLAKLSRDGIVFQRHYAPSGRCGPTRASIMSGRHNREVGVRDNGNQLRIDQFTIGDYLKTIVKDGNGQPIYRTGYVGKWHLGNGGRRTSSEHGFDETFVYYGPSRRHNRTTTLKCAPPNDDMRPDSEASYFCTKDLGKPGGQNCTTDAGCNVLSGCTDGSNHALCACAPGDVTLETKNVLAGHCYLKNPDPCSGPDGTTCPNDKGTCRRWGSYLGPQRALTPSGKEYEKRVGCHPDDIDNPLCCVPRPKDRKVGRDDAYHFNKLRANAQRYWSYDTSTVQPCYDNTMTMRDASPVGSGNGGCRYDTRYYRDVAKNFILRNRDRRFFLYIAPHGLHAPSFAPKRVEAHYRAAWPGTPSAPNEAVGFWAAMEELDAAIGQILDTVKGFCDGDPAIHSDFGEACTAGTSCDSGTCDTTTLAQNTLVLLTTDHGRPGDGYGQPALRGGKSNVQEGGIRVGLQAWSGSDLDVGSQSSEQAEEVAAGVSSHADLLATVIHAAGCKPDQNGQYTIRSCANADRNLCDSDQDCGCAAPPAVCETPCIERTLASRTLLPTLSHVARELNEGANGPIPGRDYAFAEYAGSGKAVMARTGLFDVNVCGISDTVAVTDPEAPPIARKRQAGSGSQCQSPADCDSTCNTSTQVCNGTSGKACSNDDDCRESCTSNGKFCIAKLGNSNCDPGSIGLPSACEWRKYPRCLKEEDCEPGQRCTTIHLRCSECPEASWKIRAVGGENPNNDDMQVRDLFDLTTNPEEEDKFLNLKTGSQTVTGAVDTIADVEATLRTRAKDWYTCVKDGVDQLCE